MTAESYLESRLQKFSILDLTLVKWVYVAFSLLMFHFYPKLAHLDWWFYGIFMLLSAFPLWVHLFSQKGRYFDKLRSYLKTNTTSNQTLLFMSCFFFAIMIGTLWPVLISYKWWIYVIIAIVLAIKPLTVSRVW